MKGRQSKVLLMIVSAMLVLAACASGTSTTTEAPAETSGSGSAPASGGEAAPAEEAEGDTIKVGILHSLSGTMAISEVSVHDAELLAIKEINENGGVLGKQIEPIIEDGASDWPTFAEKARKLISSDQVATVFGGWTSASRKAMLPVFEELNGLLWYPVQYEGLEQSPNIMYTGATTNQQIVPSVTWLLENRGKTFFLLGSDYVFPRTANKIIKAQLEAEGGTVVGEEYTPLGHTDYSTIISKIQAANPDIVYNTLNGDSNVAFFKQLKDAGIGPDKMTTLSVSVAEEEVRGIGPDVLAGHLTAWNYYQTTETEANKKFVEAYKAAYGADRVTSDPAEAGYIAVYLWAAAVEKAGTTDVDAVKAAAAGLTLEAPGGLVTVDGETQHIHKTVRIGEVQADGMIKELYSTPEPVKPDPYLKGYEWASGLSEQ
ncbi:urea ABC transporter substrate-binding protein [Paenibacillus sp.]|uniref:urea ABC transporter substrate-binding protein n=1 Tax=Paenibacillus sp. TaxID=58172 RepID=UPI002D4E16A5|nr:urea ABC transporter substrate-binding protein [Paenibacillus sp.]HZG87173.1 urea ABC transporter substrate-binding protein [Paenibacillus sp.]